MCGLRKVLINIYRADWLFFVMALVLSVAYIIQNVLAYWTLMCQELLDQGRNAFIKFLCQIHMFMIVICGFIGCILIAINLKYSDLFSIPGTEHNFMERRYKMRGWTWLYFAICHVYGFKLLLRLIEMILWWTKTVTGTDYNVVDGSEMDRCLTRTGVHSTKINETICNYSWEPVYKYFQNYALMMTVYETLHLILIFMMVSYVWKKYARPSIPRPSPPIVEITLSQL